MRSLFFDVRTVNRTIERSAFSISGVLRVLEEYPGPGTIPSCLLMRYWTAGSTPTQ